MMKSMKLLQEDFNSSTGETPQFRAFYYAFKADLKRTLKKHIKQITFSKQHFYVSGFFELNDGGIYYFNIGDVRWFKEKMLLRTAKSFEDFTGGPNGYILCDESFADNLLLHLGVA